MLVKYSGDEECFGCNIPGTTTVIIQRTRYYKCYKFQRLKKL